MPLERAQHREPEIRPAAGRRDVRAAVCRGGRLAARQACCREPGWRLAQVLPSVRVSLSEQGWLLAPGTPDAPQAHRLGAVLRASVSPRAQAQAGPPDPLPEVAAEWPDVPRAEEVSPAWAVEPPDVPRAVAGGWDPDVPLAAVLGPVAAEPRPEAAKAASERPAEAAAGAPDVLQAEAAAEEPGGPQGAAAAVAVRPGAAVRLLVEAQEAVQL